VRSTGSVGGATERLGSNDNDSRNRPWIGSLEALVELLETSGCVVERIGPSSVRVVSGWPVRDEGGRYELDGYLTVFEATHPGVRAERVG
jgi:hypothetical protein